MSRKDNSGIGKIKAIFFKLGKFSAKNEKNQTRDKLGKFTTNTGGLQTIKKFNWGRAIPLILAISVVGGYLIISSRAATLTVAKVPVPSTGAYWGINLESPDHVLKHEATATGNRKFNIVRKFYSSWSDINTIPTQDVKLMADEGRYVHMSIKTPRWSEVGSGLHDVQIDALATRLKDWNKPVILTLWHEADDKDACDFPKSPNSAGCMGTASDYRAMWQRVHGRFQQKGARNVSFAWVAIAYGFTPASNRSDWVKSMYPGDNYVDWLGVDAYNFINTDANNFAKFWKPQRTYINDWYQWAALTGKPLMLAEWGSLEDTSQPGRKAEWFMEFSADLKILFPKIKAVVYFDRKHQDDGVYRDWQIQTSTTSSAAYYAMGKEPYFNPVIPEPTSTTDQLPEPYIASPVGQSTVSGSVLFSVGMKTAAQPTRVDYYIDGLLVMSATKRTWYGWSSYWNSTKVSNGNHTLRAVAVSEKGSASTSTITINVNN